MTKYVESLDTISPEQAGFRNGYSTRDHNYIHLQNVIDLYQGKKMYAAFIDYKKAFDSIDRISL